MAYNKGLMSDETFRQLIKEDEWISNIARPVACYDKFHKFLHFKTCSYPYEYIVTEEQIAEAKKLWEKRRQEEIASLEKGVLAFVAMGCDFTSKYENGVGNHRMRGDFKNSKGEQFFVEFTRFANEEIFTIEYSIDRALQKKYNKECEEQFERNAKLPWKERNHRGIPQYYYNARGAERKEVKATWDDVLEFINETYGCNYKSAKLFHWFVRPEDFVSEC